MKNKMTDARPRPLNEEEMRALEAAYLNCRFVIRANIRKYINKSDLCDDCEQDTYLRAIDNIDSFMASKNREGWLVNASTIAALRLLKSNKRYYDKIVPLEAAEAVVRTSIALNFSAASDKNAVIAYMKKYLSRKNGEFFETVIKADKSNKDLAVMLNTTESAIRAKWKRMIDEILKLPDEVKDKLNFL